MHILLPRKICFSSELRCKCCHKMDCQCKCEAVQGHFFSNPSPSGYNCSVKTVIVKANTIQKKGTEALENLFQELFESDINLLLKFRKIVNSMESKILNIVPGCVEARLQILSYTALLKLSLLPVKGGSEGIKQLAPLHQKLQNAIEEELSDVSITSEMLSFTNNFEGGSYRKALEYFCKGFAIDDMLPIIKKPKQFQNIDYLCIDIKNDPWTTLSDLKREFVKRRHRKLHEFQRKVLKGEPMSKSDYSLNIMLIDNVLNKPDGKCGKKFKKDTDKELPGKEVKKVIQNTNCQEKKSQKSEKSKILEKEKITKPFEGLKTSEIQLERREEFKNLGKKKRKIKAAEMDMKIEEGGGLRKETYNLEPSTEKVHTLDHQVKLETGLDDEPVLKQSKITDYKKELTEEKGPQKPPPSTMKERKVTKRKLQGGRNSNKKGQQKMTFEVVSFSKLRYKPKKCYGCGKDIRDVADSDLILKTQGVREYYSGCRQRHLAFHKSNVYFHFLEKCVRKKYGLINRYTFDVPNDISGCLTGAQHAMLRSMENIQDVGDTRFQSKMGRNDLEPY
ncbi:uncharacterized protein [Chiloscyllium punctatum]|uniref:uncharacterized protein isoform X1 n=1 Tax=Chiloscyllium punctatum TaxID=137246 RepID=UPI003B636D40